MKNNIDLLCSFFLLVIVNCLGTLCFSGLYAQNQERAGIQEQLGRSISTQLPLVNSTGHEITLKRILSEGKPIIFVPVYYECPMLCGLVLQGLVKGLKELSWEVGGEFRVVFVSIDPDENEFLAEEKKKSVLAEYGDRGNANGWYFLTGLSENIKVIMDEVGFQYYYNEETEEYVHSAGIMFITPEGKIARYLYGIQYLALDIQNALFEAANGKVGTTLEKVILYCYSYDDSSKTYVSMAWNIMKVGGAITFGGILLFVGYLWYHNHKSSKIKS